MSGESPRDPDFASQAPRADRRSTEDGSRHDGLRGPRPEERPRPNGQRSEQGIRVAPGQAATHHPRRTTISALVKHESGVLAEVSGLVSRRQFNIESLTVGPTTNPETARITLVIDEPEPGVRQVERQLQKLVPVISVRELGNDALRRELVVLKVHAEKPEQVEAITRMYDGTTLDAGPRTITVEITGDEQKIDDAIDAFRQFGIRELARTGSTALARGDEWTTEAEESRYERTTTADADSTSTTSNPTPPNPDQ
jgi:acetolactate synthase-1/3 small subunit